MARSRDVLQADMAMRGASSTLPRSGRFGTLGSSHVRLLSGELAQWQSLNRTATIGHSLRELRAAGNLENLRTLATADPERYRGKYPFLDTDLFKTLDGLAYEINRPGMEPDPETAAFFEESVTLIEAAQAADGYLNSFYQNPHTDAEPWSDLAWGHELYNLGHLIQAAVAANRQLGDRRLLDVAVRFADLAIENFGTAGAPEVCGHPVVEMALVELYRETGDRSYLDQAKLFIDRRGHGTIKLRTFTAEYFQDNQPLRELPSVTGHAVRMAYLAAGAADVALESGDPGLLAELERLWDDMVSSKLYVTGGLGSRHSDEAIGDRFELPSERSYSETCAAIATMQWAWRMFLAQGNTKYLDTFETILHNAYAVSLSTDGKAFFYDNTLQRREDHEQRSGCESGGELLRRAWFGCPCCPPNIIRWVAELQDHLAVTEQGVLRIANYASASIAAAGLRITMHTDFPWNGAVRVTVDSASLETQGLAFRIPAWAKNAELSINGEPQDVGVVGGWLEINRSFTAGDVLDLNLEMASRFLGSHPHLDATRGCLAATRGPIVYCLEQEDAPRDINNLVLDSLAMREVREVANPVPRAVPSVALSLSLRLEPRANDQLYPEYTGATPVGQMRENVTLIPYAHWGNREPRAMRVWLRNA
ncbi:glycoside hydrolase family 127 protein [Paeniglutamicibacter sp. NPDC012692]|uniref:glycoside hydrolase family 127 protein n=1 Tax=Paeniglutamicibacter sp. NPDC012692 TaxID=3364388 RepID=UPI003688A4A6